MTPYYDSGGITIYHGDCREILPTIGPVDIVLTDPPYSSITHDGARTGDVDDVLVDFPPVSADVLREIFARCSPARWCVATMDWQHVAELARTTPTGLRFVRFGVWVKPNGAPQFTGDRPGMGWEAVAILHRADVPMRWNGGGHHAVWTFNKENTDHPTGKPLSLVRHLCRLFSDEGETILDPFMGSGTTLRAAKDLGRRAIGIEINLEYVKIAVERLKQDVLPFNPQQIQEREGVCQATMFKNVATGTDRDEVC